MKTLQNKHAIVTGTASGIGQALALALAKEGVHLDLWDRDAEGLAETAQEARSHGVRVEERVVDLTQTTEWERAVDAALEAWGTIDLLINNAGICYYGPTASMTDKQWHDIMEVNLLAPIGITRRLLPHLLERPDPHLLNMCSISGIVASGRIATYHTTKFGLVGFTEALRAEYGRQGLGVTALCPGPVSSKLYDNMMNGRGRGKEVPRPPRILSASPETIAKRAIKAIRKNQRRPIITPLAHFIFQTNKFAPWLIDWMNQLGRGKRLRLKAAAAAEQTANANSAAEFEQDTAENKAA